MAQCEVCRREVTRGSLHNYIVAQGTVLRVCPQCWGMLLGRLKRQKRKA
jgi:ribosome-binding protein aMBF1 (putative translation factor)